MGRTRSREERREIAYDPLPSQKRFHECGKRFKGKGLMDGGGAVNGDYLKWRLCTASIADWTSGRVMGTAAEWLSGFRRIFFQMSTAANRVGRSAWRVGSVAAAEACFLAACHRASVLMDRGSRLYGVGTERSWQYVLTFHSNAPRV